MWSICEDGVFAALMLIPHTAPAEQWEQGGSWWREKAGEVHCCGGGESLDAEGNAWVWRLLEREGNGTGAANHLHTRWDVRQARGTYGSRSLTQPREHILPSEDNLLLKGNQLSSNWWISLRPNAHNCTYSKKSLLSPHFVMIAEMIIQIFSLYKTDWVSESPNLIFISSINST